MSTRTTRTPAATGARPASERIAGLDEETANGFFAPALAYRGHLRDAYAVISRYPGMMAWGAYTGLALAGIVPSHSADSIFARQLQYNPGPRASGVQQNLTFPLPWWSADSWMAESIAEAGGRLPQTCHSDRVRARSERGWRKPYRRPRLTRDARASSARACPAGRDARSVGMTGLQFFWRARARLRVRSSASLCFL